MFLTDSEVQQMTGIARPQRIRKAAAEELRAWLVEHGYTEDVDFFKRIDGWYSVLHPAQRAAIELPKPRVRRRA